MYKLCYTYILLFFLLRIRTVKVLKNSTLWIDGRGRCVDSMFGAMREIHFCHWFLFSVSLCCRNNSFLLVDVFKYMYVFFLLFSSFYSVLVVVSRSSLSTSRGCGLGWGVGQRRRVQRRRLNLNVRFGEYTNTTHARVYI